MGTADGTFDLRRWQRRTRHRFEDGARLTQLVGTQRFDGDIEGEGPIDLLMWIPPEGVARFVGVHHVDGAVGEREGSFVLESSGEIDGSATRGTLEVVEGSGTGDLSRIQGTGRFETLDPTRATYHLDISVAGRTVAAGG